VSPERDEQTRDQEFELYEDVPPRSIFAATWFRVVLIVIVLGVIGAVAVPYALDWMNPAPPARSASATKPSFAPTAAPLTGKTSDSGEKPASEPPPSSKPAADARGSTVLPAPGAAPLVPAPAAPEPKGASSSTTRSSADSKPVAKAALPDATPSESRRSKSAPAKAERTAKSDAGKSDASTASASRQVAAKTSPAATGGGAGYWVQIGAFKDQETARRVASKLRDERFKVEESVKRVGVAPVPAAKAPASGTGADRYEVFVSGASAEDLNRRLAGKGLTGEAAPGGSLVVKPSLALGDAVALSKDLAVEGFKVQVRRAGTGAVAAAPPPGVAEGGDQALHRVRVGAFADKDAALAAVRELEAKGYKPYIARGDQ